MGIVGAGHGKLILFGEHAAVYGYPAVGFGLPWKVKVSIVPAIRTYWNLTPKQELYRPQLEALLKVLDKRFSLPTCQISFSSEVPIGVGFGSSGALCVALIRAVNHLSDTPLTSPTEIWREAHTLEKLFHTTPSGVDTGLSLFPELCAFSFEESLLPSRKSLHYNLPPMVIAAVPRRLSTKELIVELSQRLNRKEHLKNLGAIASEASSISARKTDVFGALANQAHHHLDQLGLSNPSLNALLEEGKRLGALGGKLSGAGGGGAYFLVCPSADVCREVAAGLSVYAEEHSLPHILSPTPLSP